MLNLKYYLSSEKRDRYIYNSNTIPLIIFQDFHSFWLINKIDYSFLYIHKLLNYDMSVFKDVIERDKLWFSNNDYCFYDNQEFKISK